ncbi:F-box protein CPR1-like [Telopea speciosissima]|uniref:F-box protein CPR1-like n=1 Tax=Telopea speciosissima TaxID=54955 RepID=UPI001CC772DA|nr:F-box protein CPR1-like [Telopea speciosissima]
MADFNEKISKVEEMANKNLPEVIIADILSRLPVKSLLRFRCICKLWCALIIDPDFIKMHLNRSLANNIYLTFIFSDTSLYSIDLNASKELQVLVKVDHHPKFVNYATEIVGSCNGLLCLHNTDEEEEDILLWNPSTKRHHKLPIIPRESPLTHFNVYGFGYDLTTDDYKVVRVAQPYSKNDYDNFWHSEVNIYSLSTDSWRRIEDMPFHINYRHVSGVLANSALHWVASRETGPYTESNFILSFDLQDEEYREVSLPDFVDEKIHMSIGVLGPQLCLRCKIFTVRVEFWVMKDYGVRESWTKQFSIEQPPLINSYHIRPICYSKNGEVMVGMNLEALILYDPVRRRQRSRNLKVRVSNWIQAEICVGSLVPLNAKDEIEQSETKKGSTRRKRTGRKPRQQYNGNLTW